MNSSYLRASYSTPTQGTESSVIHPIRASFILRVDGQFRSHLLAVQVPRPPAEQCRQLEDILHQPRLLRLNSTRIDCMHGFPPARLPAHGDSR